MPRIAVNPRQAEYEHWHHVSLDDTFLRACTWGRHPVAEGLRKPTVVVVGPLGCECQRVQFRTISRTRLGCPPRRMPLELNRNAFIGAASGWKLQELHEGLCKTRRGNQKGVGHHSREVGDDGSHFGQ